MTAFFYGEIPVSQTNKKTLLKIYIYVCIYEKEKGQIVERIFSSNGEIKHCGKHMHPRQGAPSSADKSPLKCVPTK